MNGTRDRMVVYYDAACPRCRRDRDRYRRMAGDGADGVEWCDVTGREAELASRGISPRDALLELHVETADGRVHRGIPAYAHLLSRLPRWRWLARLIRLPVVEPLLGRIYRWSVRRRLRRQNRL